MDDESVLRKAIADHPAEDAPGRVLDMPNLSVVARISGLASAGFRALADKARRQAEASGLAI